MVIYLFHYSTDEIQVIATFMHYVGAKQQILTMVFLLTITFDFFIGIFQYLLAAFFCD